MEELGRYLLGGSVTVGVVIGILRFAQSTYMKDRETRANLGGNLSVVGNQKDLIDDLTDEAERWKKDYFNERARADEWQAKYIALAETKRQN